jgi:hypothetical protein
MTNVEYMNIINDFLKNPIIPEVKEDIIVSDKELASINDLFASNDVPVNYLHLRPKIKENQIWTIKRSYMDYEGILQSAAAPIMVLLVSQEEMIGEDGMFVRVCPISPFVEMAYENDQICEEESITGFPFFIERWNEQPILTEILDKYVGDYYWDSSSKDCKLTNDQEEFREIEISNARFLNHSVIAFMNNLERSENFSFSVDVNYEDYSKTKHMPQMNVLKPRLIPLNGHEEYAMAARTNNIVSENDCIEFNYEHMPFFIEVRKKKAEFILTIIPKVEVVLRNLENKQIEGTSNSERIVYGGLRKGLYQIESPLLNKTITIRLK